MDCARRVPVMAKAALDGIHLLRELRDQFAHDGLGLEAVGVFERDLERRDAAIQRLDAESVRDAILAASGGLNKQMGGPSVFPKLQDQVLASMKYGIWERDEDGPKVWRRSVYVYQRRSLPYPMFDTFDHPDMNVTAGARNVSTVPTQALTLLNNPFVLAQAQRLAERVTRDAHDAPSQINLAYQIALARPATQQEMAVGRDLIARYSLLDLTHVIVNLNEFMYLR